MDPEYTRKIKKISESSLVYMTDLPGIDVKEAAEMVAHAAIENINNPQPSSSSSGIELQEDEQWMLAAYMEGIGEFQEEMDAKVRKSLKNAFGKIQQGLDQIEEAHKMALKAVETQREGLIKLNEVCKKTLLFKVASVIEKVKGISVTEDEDENFNVDNCRTVKVKATELYYIRATFPPLRHS